MTCHRLRLTVLAAFVIAACAAGAASVRAGNGLCRSPVFSTYFGGSKPDSIRDVAFDADGNVFVTGGTASSDFPTTPGAYDRTFNGWHDVFVAKFDPHGDLIWSTFLGGPNYDRAYGIEVDALGFVYLTGRSGRNFPVTPGAFQMDFQGFYTGNAYGHQNAFVAKLTPDGSDVVWASYFGPVQGNRDLAIDQEGDVYVASGYNPANGGTFPRAWFGNAFQKKPSGDDDGVVAKIRSDGSAVIWATYLGGSGREGATPSIRVDARGHPYLLFGWTNSNDLPTTPGAYDRSYNGGWDVYLAKLTPDGSDLIYATYLGGSAMEFSETHGLALDNQGNAYVAATTMSVDFPYTPQAVQQSYGGSGGGGNYPGDGFIAKFSPDGRWLLASTFLGGRSGDGIEGVAVDAQGNVYVSGATYSDNFPVSARAYQPAIAGDADLFVVKLSPQLDRILYGTYMGGSDTDFGRTCWADDRGNVVVAGHGDSPDWPVVNAYQPNRRGNSNDGLLARFASCELVGDFDRDGDVDLDDFRIFHTCLTGPGKMAPRFCRLGDCDEDNDIDLADYAAFQSEFTGPLP